MSYPARLLCLAVVLSLLVPAVAPAVAQSGAETVTMTVAVRTADGDPVGSADLDVTWDSGATTATTASNGKAFVDVPDGARVSVAVTHPRYVRDSPFVVDAASDREVSVTVYRKSTLRLEVSGPDGVIADASVLVERGGLDVSTGTTGENGVFETGVLQAGDYTVTVTKSGYYVRRKPIRIEGDITNRVALRPGTLTLTVGVVDPHFDPPQAVDDASVRLSGVGSQRTDDEGNASLEVPVNTRTTLRVTKDGYGTVSREVRIGEENGGVSVQFSRTPTLTASVTNERIVAGTRAVLTVTDAYGDPAAGASVTLDGESVGTVGEDGTLAVPIEAPGEHTLRATRDGVASDPVTVEAVDVDTTPTPAPPTAETTASTPTETAAGAPGFTAGVTLVLAALGTLAAGVVARRR
jgi:hypothetical protein